MSRTARTAGGAARVGGAAAERRRGRALALVLGAAALCAAVAYRAWPLPVQLGGRIETGDAWARADQELVAWILSWGAHALTTGPARVFDANIFYPVRDALARSEHLLGLAPFALPVFAATGNPQATYNATVLLVVLTTALATFVAVRAWSGSNAAALLSAVLFALAPMNVAAWNRLHSAAVHLFPLVLYLAWRCATDARRSAAVWLAVATALQVLAGVYVAFELAALLAAFLPAVVFEARRRGRPGARPVVGAAAGALALALIAPPYLRVRAAGALPDYSVVQVGTLDFAPLATLAFLEHSLPWPFWLLAALGAGAAGAPWRLRAGLVAVAAVGLVLALGPGAGVYALAQELVPGFATMRAPSRFLVLPLLALALLAGIGAASLEERLARRRRAVAAAIVLAAVLVVALRPSPPFAVVPAARRSAETYAWLAQNGEGRAVLEVPVVNDVLDTTRLLQTTGYMLGSTVHWLPLVNGYSGHPPPSDRLLMTLAQRLPDPAALAALRALADPGWLVVHLDRLGPEAGRWEGAAERLGLPTPLRLGEDLVFRLPGYDGELVPALLGQMSGDAHASLGGVPQDPLPAAARLGAIAGDLPDVVPAERFLWVWVTVRNEGNARWPGLSAVADGVVGLELRWRDPRTDAVVRAGGRYPLAADLAPGESIAAQAGIWAPPPGEYDLEVGLVQSGSGWFAETGGRGTLRGRVDVEG